MTDIEIYGKSRIIENSLTNYDNSVKKSNYPLNTDSYNRKLSHSINNHCFILSSGIYIDQPLGKQRF